MMTIPVQMKPFVASIDDRKGFLRAARGVLFMLLVATHVSVSLAAQQGRMVPAGQMTRPRNLHTATLLRDGRVLLFGGSGPVDYPEGPIAEAEIYDPASRMFTMLPADVEPRSGHTATLLADGRVLIAGGCCMRNLRSALLFDPRTGEFSPTGPMREPRYLHTATLLRDGRVLLLGGFADSWEPEWSVSPEIYDPASGTFSPADGVPPTEQKFALHVAAATLLNDGRVLIAGWNRPELYDPASGTFRFAAAMLSESYRYGSYGLSATALRDGTVLIAGGSGNQACAVASAEIYDPSTDRFTMTGRMSEPRRDHSATLLQDGRVLLAGGFTEGCRRVATVEFYDPASRSVTELGRMTEPRSNHTATPLLDGSVLIAGGTTAGPEGMKVLASAELFVPSASDPPGPGEDACLPAEHSACLLGRFRVEVRYRSSFDNGPADAEALAKVTEGFADTNFQTAFFYFFNSPNNVEAMVKVLDQGNRLGDVPTIAVVTGVATPLRVEVHVTDTRPGGTSKVYVSEFGSQAGVTDFTAFPK
jgi:hypothetical protein